MLGENSSNYVIGYPENHTVNKKLDADGIIAPETPVDGSDVLVFRYSKSNDISIKEGEGNVRDASKIQDVSLTARRTETGKIDTVMISMQ